MLLRRTCTKLVRHRVQLMFGSGAVRTCVTMTNDTFSISSTARQKVYTTLPRLKEKLRGSEVYISGITAEMDILDIVALFEKAGRIHEVRILLREDGSYRGYGFVLYFDPTSANRAVQIFRGCVACLDSMIVIQRTIDNKTLFVTGLPLTKSAYDVKVVLAALVQGISNVTVQPPPRHSNYKCGFAHVAFANRKFAVTAKRKLKGVQLWHESINMDWARPNLNGLENKIANLHISNITDSVTSDELTRILSQKIPNQDIIYMYKHEGSTFIHFSSRIIAETALAFLQGLTVEGQKIEAKWTKPMNTPKKNHKNVQQNNVDFEPNKTVPMIDSLTSSPDRSNAGIEKDSDNTSPLPDHLMDMLNFIYT